MPILEHKKIYDDSKKVFKNLTKELDNLIAKEEKLIKTNKDLAESLELVKKTGDGKEAKALTEKTNKLTTSTKKLKDALTAEERVKQQILRANVKLAESRTKAARDLAKVNAELAENRRRNKEAGEEMAKVKKKTSAFSNSMNKLTASIKNVGKQLIGAAGLIGGVLLLGRVLKGAFKIMVEFSKASSGLAAILQKTKKEIKVLTEQAKELGRTTAFTATQVIKLQTELARLGFSINEIRDSTPAILDLGAALRIDLADAAAVAGGIVRAFGLSTKDTKEIVDSMVATMNNSGASFEDYREAVAKSAPIFKAANIDFKTMNLLIGKLADSQIKGTVAGTGLKNLVSKLSNENSKLSKQLGFTVKNSDDLVKAFGLLKTQNIDLTEATELTDERSKAAFLTLIEGVDSADKLSTALNNLDDNARKTAKTMLDNLAGDITIAESAYQGFVQSIADGEGIVSKAMRSLVQDFTDFLGELTKFNEVGIIGKLKLIANAAISLFTTAFLPLAKVLEKLGIDMPRFTVEVDKGAKSLSGLNDELATTKKGLSEADDEVVELTEDQKKLNIELEKQIKAEKKLEAARQKSLDNAIKTSEKNIETTETEAEEELRIQQELDEALLNEEEKYQEEKAIIIDKANLADLEKSAQLAEQKKELLIQAEGAGQQIASNIFAGFQDERIAKIQSDAEAQKKILQQRLDDGLISEQQFSDQIAAIDKKAREDSAKAERRKALFDIAITTAVNIVKAALTPWLIPGIIAAGALQALVVSTKKLNKGEVNLNKVPGSGNSDTFPALLTPGESVINQSATSKSEGLLNMINSGMLTDKNVGGLSSSNSDGLLASLLMQGNKNSDSMLTALSNLGFAYKRDGQWHVRMGDGSKEIFI